MTQGAVLITGGGGTIGASIGQTLTAQGRDVVLWDRDPDVSRIAEEIGARFACVDITDMAACRAELDRIGPLGALVHCAGIGKIVPFDETDRALWDQVMEINLTTPVFLTQTALPYLTQPAQVILIASVSGIRAGFGRVAYGTSKAALIHLARQLAVELAPRGISVNAVAPGPVAGPLAEGSHPAAQVADYLAQIPQGRYAQPHEIAATVAFLTMPEAAHISGQCIAIDGGYLSAGVGLEQARTYADAVRT